MAKRVSTMARHAENIGIAAKISPFSPFRLFSTPSLFLSPKKYHPRQPTIYSNGFYKNPGPTRHEGTCKRVSVVARHAENIGIVAEISPFCPFGLSSMPKN